MQKQKIFIWTIVASTIVLFGSGTASAVVLTENHRLTASDAATGDSFGGSVCIDGDYAIVGAAGASSAYIYEYNGSSWTEAALIGLGTAPNSVAISGDTAVIGSTAGNTAWVYQRDGGGTWGQVATLAHSYDGDFGYDVGIDGDVVIVGARQASNNGFKAGGAAAYYRDAGGADSWGQVQTFFEGGAYGRFGYSVDISGNTIIIGSQYQENAWTYTGDGAGTWDNSAETAFIGVNQSNSRVAIDGDRVVIGRPSTADTPDVQIWDRGELGWSMTTQLFGGAGFGTNVDVAGDLVLIGSPSDDPDAAGVGYLYELDGTWSQLATLTTTGRTTGDGTGTDVRLSGLVAILGSPSFDAGLADTGAAQIYTIPEPGTIALLAVLGMALAAIRRR